MMQAIGRIERALSRIEGHICTAPSESTAPPADSFDREEALEALRALDGVIADLKEKAHG